MNTIKTIISALASEGIVANEIPSLSWHLIHSLSQDEFEAVIKKILLNFAIKPQEVGLYPGSPTGETEDWGFYIRPIDGDDWEEGDFDMAIYIDSMHWC